MGTLRGALTPDSQELTSVSRAFQELCDSGVGKLRSPCTGTYYLLCVLSWTRQELIHWHQVFKWQSAPTGAVLTFTPTAWRGPKSTLGLAGSHTRPRYLFPVVSKYQSASENMTFCVVKHHALLLSVPWEPFMTGDSDHDLMPLRPSQALML